MSLLSKVAVAATVVIVGIPTLFISWGVYKAVDARLNRPAVLTESEQEVQRKRAAAESRRKCIVAELAEGASTWNDQVLIARAMMRMEGSSLSACTIFSKYTLMRAPSQLGGPMSVRDPDAVIAKRILAAWEERISSAEEVTLAALRGEFLLKFGKDQLPEVELKWRRALECNERFIRVWQVFGVQVNTPGTDTKKMYAEMDGDNVFVSPSGTQHFCPRPTK